MNGFATEWFNLYALALVQNTVFLALVFLALHFLRSAPAQSRYLVGLLGLLKLCTPPFLTLPVAAPRSMELVPVETLVQSFPFLVGGGGTVAELPAIEAGSSAPSWTVLVFLAWACGAVLTLLIPAVATLRLARVLRRAQPLAIEPELRAHLPKRIEVRMSDEIALPLTLTFFPRRIFVPRAWNTWPLAQRRLFLRHELAHLRRWDGPVQVLQVLVLAVFWMHPMVHFLSRRLDELREMACDDDCLQPEPHRAARYAWYMVDVAESVLRTRGMALDTASRLLGRQSELSARVDYQLQRLQDGGLSPSTPAKGNAMASLLRARTPWVLIVLALFVLPLSWTWSAEGAYTADPTLQAQATPAPPPPGDHESVSIRLGGNGQMDIEGNRTAVLEFGSKMMVHRSGDASKVVLDLECDDDLQMAELHAYQQVFVKAGFRKIRYVDVAGQGHPLMLPGPDLAEKLAGVDKAHVMRLIVNDVGEVKSGEKPVPIAKLKDVVRERVAADEALVVTIETAPGTRYADYLPVFVAAQQAGAKRLAVVPPPPPKS